jgi:hypothetical protein
MAKRSKDINETALNVLQQVIGEIPKEPHDSPKEKNPAAVALGRLGGLKGGRARSEKLSPEKRKEIASNAAKARWIKTIESRLNKTNK